MFGFKKNYCPSGIHEFKNKTHSEYKTWVDLQGERLDKKKIKP